MKVVRKQTSSQGEKQSFTLRLSRETIRKLDQISQENDISRQRLVESIVEQVLKDKKFTLEVG